MSIEAYNGFAKDVDPSMLIDGGDIDEIVQDIVDAVPIEEEVEVPASDGVETIFTLSFKRDGGNVAARIDADGNLITTNSDADIIDAISFLRSKLS